MKAAIAAEKLIDRKAIGFTVDFDDGTQGRAIVAMPVSDDFRAFTREVWAQLKEVCDSAPDRPDERWKLVSAQIPDVLDGLPLFRKWPPP